MAMSFQFGGEVIRHFDYLQWRPGPRDLQLLRISYDKGDAIDQMYDRLVEYSKTVKDNKQAWELDLEVHGTAVVHFKDNNFYVWLLNTPTEGHGIAAMAG